MATVKVLARLRGKYGGKLEDVEVPNEIFTGMDMIGFQWISKLWRVPQALRERYTMLYVPDRNIKEG